MTDREVVELEAHQRSRPALVLPKPATDWTPAEILDEIESGSTLAVARAKMLAALNLRDLAPFEEWDSCRAEFQAIVEIAKALGFEIVYGIGDTAE